MSTKRIKADKPPTPLLGDAPAPEPAVDAREMIPLGRLKTAPWNPKRPIQGEFRRGLHDSLETFGVRDDLKVWPDPAEPGTYFVINGNQRLDLLRERGADSAECRILADLDEPKARLFTAAFDRNHAQYDDGKLALEAQWLAAQDDADAELIRRMLRPEAAPAVELDEPTASVADEPPEPETTVPIMFEVSVEAYEAIKGTILKSKARLIREQRLAAAFEGFNAREIDDGIAETVMLVFERKKASRARNNA